MPEMSLYDWWRDYIYDAVYPFQGSYPTLVQYDSQSIIEYCGIRMFLLRRAVGTHTAFRSGHSCPPARALHNRTSRSTRIRLRVDRDDGQIHYFYMAPHEDGSGYYFKRIEVNYGQLPKEVEFEGEYITVDTLLGMPASGAGSLHCWGEIGGKLLLSWSSGMSGYVVLGLVDS